jgi:alkanesulfonate monooxygenase SsuD/methylene tetrahydromethanopterin reductase-like flavin-dependent oxidoreductase (luciferase family)
MNTKRTTARGVGLAVAISRDVILDAAAAVEKNGYSSFWLNNPPRTDALAVLSEVARIAPSLQLGVGVVPLSDRSPDQIATAGARSGLPMDRAYLGIGSGSGPGGLQRVEAGLQALRSVFQGHIAVAALGPKMCRLAGARADGVLFNWLTPDFAARAIAWVREGAEEASRPLPRLIAYARVGLGEEAIARLRVEAATYESYPAYAAHFRRMGTSAMDTTIAASTPDDIQRGLAAWDGVVDDVIVRAITAHDTTEEILHLVEAARPR